MQWNDHEVSANVSLLFAELPYPQRFMAAADAGFRTVESWWPFAEPHPGTDQLDELAGLISEAGVRLTGLNFYAGDMPAGERGIACQPDRTAEMDSAIESLVHMARATGCRGFNLLHGQLDPSIAPAAQHATAVHSYRRAAEAVADIDGTVLVEPLAKGLNGTYPLLTPADAIALIDEVDSSRLALLVDTFHLGRNGIEVPEAVVAWREHIGHVQLADTPDRGEPGSGALDWAAIADSLRRIAYTGTVAAEYKPTTETLQTFGWLSSQP